MHTHIDCYANALVCLTRFATHFMSQKMHTLCRKSDTHKASQKYIKCKNTLKACFSSFLEAFWHILKRPSITGRRRFCAKPANLFCRFARNRQNTQMRVFYTFRIVLFFCDALCVTCATQSAHICVTNAGAACIMRNAKRIRVRARRPKYCTTRANKYLHAFSIMPALARCLAVSVRSVACAIIIIILII